MSAPVVTPELPARAAPPALVFIFVTLVLDMLSIGIIIPGLPKLVENFMGGDTARAAEIFGVFGTVWALMGALAEEEDPYRSLTGVISTRATPVFVRPTFRAAAGDRSRLRPRTAGPRSLILT